MSPEFLKNVVVFGAQWCNDCKALKRRLEKFGNDFTYIDVDTDTGRKLSEEAQIRNLPGVYVNGTQIPGAYRYLENEWKEFQRKNAIEELAENPLNVQAMQEIEEEDDYVARGRAARQAIDGYFNRQPAAWQPIDLFGNQAQAQDPAPIIERALDDNRERFERVQEGLRQHDARRREARAFFAMPEEAIMEGNDVDL